jgi:hypothetical protein
VPAVIPDGLAQQAGADAYPDFGNLLFHTEYYTRCPKTLSFIFFPSEARSEPLPPALN